MSDKPDYTIPPELNQAGLAVPKPPSPNTGASLVKPQPANANVATHPNRGDAQYDRR